MLKSPGLLPAKLEIVLYSREESPGSMLEVLSQIGIQKVPLHAVDSLDTSKKAAIKRTQFVEPDSLQCMSNQSTESTLEVLRKAQHELHPETGVLNSRCYRGKWEMLIIRKGIWLKAAYLNATPNLATEKMLSRPIVHFSISLFTMNLTGMKVEKSLTVC
jgi:hypothetical protein